jgi:hypothetical protein
MRVMHFVALLRTVALLWPEENTAGTGLKAVEGSTGPERMAEKVQQFWLDLDLHHYRELPLPAAITFLRQSTPRLVSSDRDGFVDDT